MSNVFVFLGPSLCVEDARAILPDATYLPPIQCGDIPRILRLDPGALVIIDGVFERVPAVWHKEILLALSRGIPVVGGGSMGALRAAEMAAFGMHGVGRSFEDYAAGRILDDDEVAIVHTNDGEALSDAMVNIRDTTDAAVARGVLSSSSGERVLEAAKAMFYAERTFEGAARSTLGELDAQRVVAWSRDGGFVDRKREDAIAALEFVRDTTLQAPRRRQAVTGFLRTLVRGAACSSQRRFRNELPHAERVACAARFLGPAYGHVKRLAQTLAALHDVAVSKAVPARDANIDPDWPADVAARIQIIEGLRESLGVTAADSMLRRIDLLRLEGLLDVRPHADVGAAVAAAWKNLFDADPARARALDALASAWAMFDRLCEAAELVPRQSDIQHHVDLFRHVRGLDRGPDMHAWLERVGLDTSAFVGLVIRQYRFENLVVSANLGMLGVDPACDTTWWLRDALWVSGTWSDAARRLTSPRAELCQMPRQEHEAYAHDFSDGTRGATRELNAMRSARMVAV